jgi:AcrR family transcriptional regulator
MKPARRVPKKKKAKQAILKAALELFAAKGFHATTTKAISKKARMANGMLLNHFETKEDLALYFFEEERSELMAWYRANRRLKKADIAEKLFAIIQHMLERFEPYEEFIGAVYMRALNPTSKLSPFNLDSQERNLRYLRFIRGILLEAEADEEIPPFGDFGAYAFGLFQLAILTHWLRDQSPGKEETLALLDRSLKMGTHFLRNNGGWNW